MLRYLKKIVKRLLTQTKIVPVYVTSIRSEILGNKVALVSGGSSGIGLAISRKMIESGCKVYILGRDEEKLKTISQSIGSEYITVDISHIDIMNEVLQPFLKNVNVDILINSAGFHGDEQFGSVTEQGWNNVLDVNLRGLYFLSQTIATHMINNNICGHILNVSSASALKPSWTPYEISKRAVNGVTLGLAQELIPYGIVVNGIAPGPTATPMLNFNDSSITDLSWGCNPSGRVATVEEIANLAVFMVSSLGDYIVGDTFYMTGGSGTININK